MRKQQPETDEAVSRIEFHSAELEREEDQTLSTSSLNAFDDVSESSTATLCSTKAFSEYLTEKTLAFVEVLGHNVMMLHSDQEPVLVQLKSVQSGRFQRTPVRHGPRTSHQSQGKIENVNQVINGVCWSMWLTLDSILLGFGSNCVASAQKRPEFLVEPQHGDRFRSAFDVEAREGAKERRERRLRAEARIRLQLCRDAVRIASHRGGDGCRRALTDVSTQTAPVDEPPVTKYVALAFAASPVALVPVPEHVASSVTLIR